MSDNTAKARRLSLTSDGRVPPFPWEPGDYCGPVVGYTGDLPAVMYALPTNVPGLRSIGHVTSPPHAFRECADGSLEIRNSILHVRGEARWHGYLNEGNVWTWDA